MSTTQLIEKFSERARNVGAEVIAVDTVAAAADFIAGKIEGSLLVPSFSSGSRFKLKAALKMAGITVESDNFRSVAAQAEAGITGVNFAIADTGTLVLESTSEDIRLATTLPPKQFALLDPHKVLADGIKAVKPLRQLHHRNSRNYMVLADGIKAVKPLRQLHHRNSRNYIAYVTGPSRTADIERVLTIGVHGPKELFILLVPGLSDDFLEM